MNKKSAIIAVSVVIIILVIACLTIVLLNNNNLKKDENDIIKTDSEEENLKSENKIETKKPENVVLNSKVGNEIQNCIYIPNIYSQYFFKQLDSSGLDDRAKIMFTFSKIVTENEYSSMLRQSENYPGDYITNEDLQKVANTIFLNANNLKHQEVYLSGSYDNENGNYIQLPTGFIEFSYVKDIVYKIEEVENEFTVYTYRMYIDCNSSDAQDESLNSTQTIYYDTNKKNKAIIVNDESMDDESKETEYLNNLINSGKINKDKLNQGMYTLIKRGNNYLIKNIK